MPLLRRVAVSVALLFFISVLGFSSMQMANADDGSAVLKSFNGLSTGAAVGESFDKVRDQHKILFYMGVALLIGVLVTAGLGVAMAILGKEVFVAHMLSAGVTVFLSIAHAVVAIVWFFPFK